MDINSIEKTFNQLGGEFLCPFSIFKERLSSIKAFIFDWDGVFNAGIKGKNVSSTFSEPDSLGLNILRFAYSLIHSEIPITGIITGMNNDAALLFAEREHLNLVYQGYKNKDDAMQDLCETYQLKPHDVAYVFDDVLDIPVCQAAGLRIMVKRAGSPLFVDYIKRNNLADYHTANSGTSYAVREVSELLIGTYGNYDQVIQLRGEFTGAYETYLDQRNKQSTQIHTWNKHNVKESFMEK